MVIPMFKTVISMSFDAWRALMERVDKAEAKVDRMRKQTADVRTIGTGYRLVDTVVERGLTVLPDPGLVSALGQGEVIVGDDAKLAGLIPWWEDIAGLDLRDGSPDVGGQPGGSTDLLGSDPVVHPVRDVLDEPVPEVGFEYTVLGWGDFPILDIEELDGELCRESELPDVEPDGDPVGTMHVWSEHDDR